MEQKHKQNALYKDAPLLTARGLCKNYDYRQVLRGVDIELGPGALTLVCGPNGAGKSTLLRVFCGLARADEGFLRVDAEPHKISYVNHKPCVYAGLTALQNLEFWTRLNKLAFSRAELEALLDKAGLTAFAHEPVQHFSQGMLQRLNLARCFANAPRLVFLDEPSTNLDREGIALLHGYIAATRESGGAVVLISHHFKENLPLADSVLALKMPSPHMENSGVSYYGPAAGFNPQGGGGDYA